jgi:TonB family protein
VSLFFALNEQGEAKQVQLAHSSGSAILDEAAMDCVLRGALPAPGRPGAYGPVTIKFAGQR